MHQIMRNGRVHAWDECTNYQESLTPPDPTWPIDVRAVAIYIHANLFDENLMVAKVKRACGIGDNNISGRFRYYVGQGIKEYIDSHRLNLAKRLLDLDHVTVIAIAFEVGYPSYSAFTKGFSRRVGCTPSVYRGRVQRNVKKKLKKHVQHSRNGHA